MSVQTFLRRPAIDARARPVSERARNVSAKAPRGLETIAIVCGGLFVAALVVLPLISVFYEAFRAGTGAFFAAFADGYARSAIVLSLEIAAIVVVANTLFGILAGWTIAKYRFPGKALLLSAIDVPLSVSPVVAGLAILLCVGSNTPFGGWLVAHGIRVAFAPPGIALATIFVTFPYVAREFATFLQEQSRDLEEAALSLGASVPQTFWRVTLPSGRYALLNGILLCNARALGEFGAVSVISGRIRGLTDTVPLHIEILYNEAAFTSAFTLAAALACVTIGLTALRNFFERRTTYR